MRTIQELYAARHRIVREIVRCKTHHRDWGDKTSREVMGALEDQLAKVDVEIMGAKNEKNIQADK